MKKVAKLITAHPILISESSHKSYVNDIINNSMSHNKNSDPTFL